MIPFYKKNKFNKFENTKNEKALNFQLYDANRVFITGSYACFTEQIRNLIKHNLGTYSDLEGEKGWLIPYNRYEYLVNQLRNEENLKLTLLPALLQKLAQPLLNRLQWCDDSIGYELTYDEDDKQALDEELSKKLYQFQRDAVYKANSLRGRILIADEMGVGKTVQSLAIASQYSSQWPLLIMCPQFLRLTWKDEIVRWLKIKVDLIQIISKSSDSINKKSRIVIISYDLCSKLQQTLSDKKFKVGIADECHYLKGQDSVRSNVCVPILKQCKYVILLTGTPALAKPKDLFNILSIIRPDIFFNFKDFAYRYCDPKQNKFHKGLDFDGAANLKELHYLLTNYIMIRRLKKEVLTELPAKRRIKIRIKCETKITQQIQAILGKLDEIDFNEIIKTTNMNQQEGEEMQIGAQAMLMKCYVLTGQAKIKGILDYLEEMFEQGVKFIFFAHHINVLNAVEEFSKLKKVQFIRIDGQVSAEEKHKNVEKFQSIPDIKIAILGLTSASLGLTLTKASTVIFGEMHWTPAVMVQAEDRCHRIGQESQVDCHYLIGDETIDDIIYDKLDSKINTVSNFIDGTKNRLGARESRGNKQNLQSDVVVLERDIFQKKVQVEIQEQRHEEVKEQVEEDDDINIDDLINMLEQNGKKDPSQHNVIQPEKPNIDSDVKQQAQKMKQTLISNFITSTNKKREATFLESKNMQVNVEVKLKKTVQSEIPQLNSSNQSNDNVKISNILSGFEKITNQSSIIPKIDFNVSEKKLGFDYLEQRLRSNQKESSGQKRFFALPNIQDQIESQIRSTKKYP